MDWHPNPGGSRNTPSRFLPRKPELSAGLMGPRGPNADFTFTLPLIIFGISTAKSKFSLAGAKITNPPPITMIASQAKHKQNRVCLTEVYYLCVRAYEK